MSSRPQVSFSRWDVVCLTALTATAFAFVSQAAPGQDRSPYLASDDLFSIDFPSEPIVREASYTTGLGVTLPARVYSVAGDREEYSVTVVDWRESEALYEAFLAGCQDCDGAMPNDIRGSSIHASFGFLQRGSEVMYLGQNVVGGVRGVRILLRNEDGSQTAAVSHWHEYRLYIVEATAPSGTAPGLFVDSIELLDQEGRRIRYDGRYAPLFPKPNRSP